MQSKDKPGAGTWVKQGDDCRVGHIVVRVSSASVKQASVMYGNYRVGEFLETKSSKDYLVVELRIHNISPTLKTTYTTWDDKLSDRPMRLTDGLGNNYLWVHRKVGVPGGRLDGGYFVDWIRLIGSTDGAILYPGQLTTDLFAFERPVDKAKKLHLELPGENCGLDRPFRLEIDLSPPPEPTAAELARALKRAEADEPAIEVGPDRPAEVRKAAEALTRLRRAKAVLDRFPKSAEAELKKDAAADAWAKAFAELNKARTVAMESAAAAAKAQADREHPVLKTGPAQDQIKSRVSNEKAVNELTEAAQAKVEDDYRLPLRKGEVPKK